MSELIPGKVLITGAAQRIGRAIALDLGKRGWTVVVHYNRSTAAAETVAGEIAAAGGKAIALPADLDDASQVEELVPLANRQIGPLTCLINNAAIFEMDTIDSTTVRSWDRHMDVNLRAPFLLAQAFARQLPDREPGNIINLIDMRVWKPTPYFTSYTISKMGLWGLTQTLAMALAPRIRVNGIGPGPSLQSSRQTAEQFARQVAATPLQRGASPEEICDGVRFILGAGAMTGQMIALDGGQHLPWPVGRHQRLVEE